MLNSDPLKDLFLEAIRLTKDQRDAFVASCTEDSQVRDRLVKLLQAHDEASDFLETADMQVSAPDTGSELSSAEQAGATIGRYKLLQLIGEGGFGSVWMAEQKEPVKRRVALKIIKLGMDTKQVIARFEAERQALALMDHPNIAKVFDAGATESGRPYFVMEYVRGIGIIEYCDTEKLDTAERLALFVKVCNAIQHAHQKGIIHRDIKPSNVMVTLHDGAPVPMVIDFGVAKATSTELTQKTLFTEHRQMIGTPAYMSPEQAEMSGLDIDTRSDIYSLGVLLYELLTGATPFEAKELMSKGYAEMMRIIREQEPQKPSTRLSTLGDTATRTADQRRADPRRLGVLLRGELDWIVMKCLEKDRTRRYETANGLAADITRHLNNEPVLAGAPSAAYRMRKFLGRNRVAVMVAAIVVLVLVAGFSIAVMGLVHAKKEQRIAEQARSHEIEAREEAATERDRAKDMEQRAQLLRRLFSREDLSLAVLPLANASGDPEQAYFAEGITRSLIDGLDRIGAIDVKSFESISKFAQSDRTDAEIASDLNVDLLLRGSVLRLDNQVQVEMTLDHASEALNLWEGTYAGDWENIFDLQRRVFEDTVRAVQMSWTPPDQQRLSGRETASPQAREAYFKGMYNLKGASKASQAKAIEFFKEASAFDPEYALPQLGLARAYIFSATLGVRPSEYNEPARRAALRALELDPSLAGAWAAIGQVRLLYDWDWIGAREAYDNALELDPYLPGAHAGLGTYYATLGDTEQSIKHLRRAVEIDPGVLLLHEEMLYTPFFTGRLDISKEMCERALEYDEDFWAPYAWGGLALAWNGDLPGAIKAGETARRLEPDSPIVMALLASIYALDGQREMAEALLHELLEWTDANYLCPYEIATVFLALGDRETAYDFIDMAVVARSECIPFMGTDVRMTELRGDERYRQIMRDVGHPLAPPAEP